MGIDKSLEKARIAHLNFYQSSYSKEDCEAMWETDSQYIKIALADQKQKIISIIRNKIKDLRNANNNHKQDLVKEEELENNVLEELININEKKITELISLLKEFEELK